MLSKAREKLIRSLKTKKGRAASGRCLVEGRKAIEAAGDVVEFTFTRADGDRYDELVDAETPQEISAVARIPAWSREDIENRRTIVVLDGVQDPGNVGGILRLCLGFSASLFLVESADATAPKVVRASAGAMFHVPWMAVPRADAAELIRDIGRTVYRLEKTGEAVPVSALAEPDPIILIAGSEGAGIMLDVKGKSAAVGHADMLESLNVGHALAIALHERMRGAGP